jgi:hypothetical protein
MQIRHGDVWLETVEDVDPAARPTAGRVLAYGEVTGHAHALTDDGLLYEAPDGTVYIRVPVKGTTLTHEEHGTVTLAPGTYRVRQQREYDPYAQVARQIVD